MKENRAKTYAYVVSGKTGNENMDKTELNVIVNRRHITTGSKSGDCCPIALALKEMGYDVYVGGRKVIFYGPWGAFVSNLAAKAKNFIQAFDYDEKPIPISFKMLAPQLK